MSFITPHTCIIAEVGTAHGGSIVQAKKLIDAAKAAGADCVKFQIVYADEILHPDTGFVLLPGGNIRLYDRFKSLEVPPSFFSECADYCAKKGVLFAASPFGIKSLRELVTLTPALIKIASPELNHVPLLDEVASIAPHIPLVLSSGVSMLSDIEKALFHTKNVSKKALLHCVTSYPAPETEYNVRTVETLAGVLGVPMGISDHSLDAVLVPVLSVLCGGAVIEKHICLHKTDGGLDDPVALTPADFSRMVERVRKAENEPKEKTLEELFGEYTKETVTAALGSGKKTLSLSESANYGRTNRSVHFMRSMKKGEVVSENDVSVLRTEKVLSVGLSPEFLPNVIGAVLCADAVNGEGVTWHHLIRKN